MSFSGLRFVELFNEVRYLLNLFLFIAFRLYNEQPIQDALPPSCILWAKKHDAALNSSQYDYGYLVAEAANMWVDEKYPDAEDGSIECAVFINSTAEDFLKRADAMKQIEKLNSKVKIVRNCDSTYSIFINRALPPELQLRSKEHEVEHIRNNDFDNSEYELELIERLFS